MHGGGVRASLILDEAKTMIARDLDCAPEEVFFTSGGTESINHALKGVAWSGKKGSVFVTSAGEHDATRATLSFLQDQWELKLHIAPLLTTGSADVKALKAIVETTAPRLVSVMAVSNETGAMNDLLSIRQMLNQFAPRAIFHSDCVQAVGKLPFSFRRLQLDMASVSGHKIGAPKGTGLLIKKKNLRLTPLIHGGGQQQGVRSGTVDVPGAEAIAWAIRHHVKNLDMERQHVLMLRKYFLEKIKEEGTACRVLSPEDGSPYVLSLAFAGLRGETLMHALSAESIYISTGAACGSKHAGDNHVLQAMGVEKSLIESAVRLSFSPEQQEEDVLLLATAIARLHRRYATG